MTKTAEQVTTKLTKSFARVMRKTPNRFLSKWKPVTNSRNVTLAPDVAISLKVLDILGEKDFSDLPVPEGRILVDKEANLAVISTIEVQDVRNTEIAGVPCRVYTPENSVANQTIAYIHGGGWVLGSLESHDITCRYLAQKTRRVVVSIDYSLAPEHPFPHGLNDIDAVLSELMEPEEAKVVVMGDSAGGNLSLTSTIKRIKEGKTLPTAIVPIVPVTNLHSFDTGSYQEFESGYFLTKKQMEWYREHYLRDASSIEEASQNPLVSPLLADSETLALFPPTLVAVDGFDPLRDEGEAMFERLKEAGAEAWLYQAEDQVHPFVNSITIWEGAEEAMWRISQWVTGAFEGKPEAVATPHTPKK